MPKILTVKPLGAFTKMFANSLSKINTFLILKKKKKKNQVLHQKRKESSWLNPQASLILLHIMWSKKTIFS